MIVLRRYEKGVREIGKRITKIMATTLLLFFLLLLPSISTNAENVVTSAQKVTSGRWVGNKYRYKNGKYAKNIWLNINGKIYRFNSTGNVQRGIIAYGGKNYFADNRGAIYINRWLAGKVLKYYFQTDGSRAMNKWLNVGNKYYYFYPQGNLARSRIITTNEQTYYVDATGARVISKWVTINGKTYYFERHGYMMKSCFVKKNGRYVYLGSNGALVKNKWVDNHYLDSSGYMSTDCVKDGWYINSAGVKTVKVFTGKYILVGDSRIYWMGVNAAASSTKFIALRGAAYSWLHNAGGVELQYYLKANPNVTVVLCMGVNDLSNINYYISYYRDLIKNFPATKFYVLSVNPAGDGITTIDYSVRITDVNIRSFNANLKAAFPEKYIDSYSYLMETGYYSPDNLHFSPETNQKIYDYIISCV